MEEFAESQKQPSIKDFEPISPDLLELLPEGMIRRNLVIPLQKQGNRLLVGVPQTKNVVKPAGLQLVAGCPVDVIALPLQEITAFIKKHFSVDDRKIEPKVFSVIQPDRLPESNPSSPLPPTFEHSDNDASPKFSPDAQNVEDLFPDLIEKNIAELHVRQSGNKMECKAHVNEKWISPSLPSHLSLETLVLLVEKRVGVSVGVVGNFQWSGEMGWENRMWGFSVVLTRSEHVWSATIRAEKFPNVEFRPAAWGLDKKQEILLNEILESKKGLLLFCEPESRSTGDIFYGCVRRLAQEGKLVQSVETGRYPKIQEIEQFPATDFDKGYHDLLSGLILHKPDVMVLSNVREIDVPYISKASENGILVVARINALDGAQALSQFLSWKMKPSYLGSLFIATVAQGGVRLLCEHCKEVDDSARDLCRREGILLAQRPAQFYFSKGCAKCNFSGFLDAVPFVEIVHKNDSVLTSLIKEHDADNLRRLFSLKRIPTLRSLAYKKAFEGLTSLTEALCGPLL